MYTCPLCEREYPYLILEYDLVVCEKCSLVKNISAEDLQSLEEADALQKIEEEKDLEEEIANDDARQLLELIERIENPKIREDFMQLAQEYLSGID